MKGTDVLYIILWSLYDSSIPYHEMCIHWLILMLFIVDAGGVKIWVPSAACINSIRISQCLHMLFNDKECFNHRLTTKICTVQYYLSRAFNHRVNTKSF